MEQAVVVVLRKPWDAFSGTCLRCKGPFTTFCVGRRCRKPVGAVRAPYDCAVCGREVTTGGAVPHPLDDAAWKPIQAEHAPDCAWASSRAYRLSEPGPALTS